MGPLPVRVCTTHCTERARCLHALVSKRCPTACEVLPAAGSHVRVCASWVRSWCVFGGAPECRLPDCMTIFCVLCLHTVHTLSVVLLPAPAWAVNFVARSPDFPRHLVVNGLPSLPSHAEQGAVDCIQCRVTPGGPCVCVPCCNCRVSDRTWGVMFLLRRRGAQATVCWGSVCAAVWCVTSRHPPDVLQAHRATSGLPLPCLVGRVPQLRCIVLLM